MSVIMSKALYVLLTIKYRTHQKKMEDSVLGGHDFGEE